MEKTLALLLLLMHVTWADEVKKKGKLWFSVFGLWQKVWWSYGIIKESNTEQRNLEN